MEYKESRLENLDKVMRAPNLIRSIAEVIAAIVNEDGCFSFHEYEAVAEISKGIAAIGDSKLLANAILVDALLHPPEFEVAVAGLASHVKEFDQKQRDGLKALIDTVLITQGDCREKMESRLNEALRASSSIGVVAQRAKAISLKGVNFIPFRFKKGGSDFEKTVSVMINYGRLDLAKSLTRGEDKENEKLLAEFREYIASQIENLQLQKKCLRVDMRPLSKCLFSHPLWSCR